MQSILFLVGASILPILVVFFLPRNKSFFEREEVKGFGLGVYLMLVVVLLMESVEGLGVSKGIMWFAFGLLISLVIGLFFKEFHHHHLPEEGEKIHNHTSTIRILVSDFFHNMVDGVAIVTGFMISPVVGGLSFLGILAHQVLQQIGQHILLIESGIKVSKAILISFLISLSIFLGFFIEEGIIAAMLLSISAGIVAWKVWVDLLDTKWGQKTITGFITGALLFAIILIAIPHAHEDEEHGVGEAHKEEAR